MKSVGFVDEEEKTENMLHCRSLSNSCCLNFACKAHNFKPCLETSC